MRSLLQSSRKAEEKQEHSEFANSLVMYKSRKHLILQSLFILTKAFKKTSIAGRSSQ